MYSVDAEGRLVGRVATSDDGDWLPNDEVPETLEPVLRVFFDEMWPYLRSAAEAMRTYLASDAHSVGDELPRKTFTATPGFEALQTGHGALTVPFEVGGIPARRMVVPYQMWMLNRIEHAMADANTHALSEWLKRFESGGEILELGTRLEGCGVRKDGGRLFSS